ITNMYYALPYYSRTTRRTPRPTLFPYTTLFRSITRSSVTHNHNLAFSGGSEATRYRASLNYAKEEGVTLSTGLERIQGRLSATRSEEHTSELQSLAYLVCRLLLEKKTAIRSSTD